MMPANAHTSKSLTEQLLDRERAYRNAALFAYDEMRMITESDYELAVYELSQPLAPNDDAWTTTC
jgi:hypothetical protein